MPTPKILGIPCWTLPIFAGLVWLITLVTLLSSWVLRGSTHYPEMWRAQHLAYISNVGASLWGRPLFTAGSIITALSLAIALIAERWMRHMGRLLHVSNWWMTALSVVTAILLVAGSSSLIFLTIFDVRGKPHIHYPLVSVFVFGYILAAAFMCVERRVLSKHYPANTILRHSFYLKLFFTIAEVLLVVICGVSMYSGAWGASVVAEWIIGLFFTFYMWSCSIDFLTTPDSGEVSDKTNLSKAPWDEEVGIITPEKARSRTVIKPYLLLP